MSTYFKVKNLKKYTITKQENIGNVKHIHQQFKNYYKKNIKSLNILLKKIFFYKSSTKDSAKRMSTKLPLK